MEPRKRNAVRMSPRSSVAGVPPPSQSAIFTAVDGTLVDGETFDSGASRAVVRKLSRSGVPVIPISVMTLDELEPIARDLGLRHAMVIEAGGAIARWSGETWEVEPCGPPADILLDVIRDIEDRADANLLVYSALDTTEAELVSGRSGAMLQAARPRRFSEPFLIERGDPFHVRQAASALGFTLRRGRRFYHLSRECDEGEAFARLCDELRCDFAIAAGASLLDAEFLSRADMPIIVPRGDGVPDPELLAKVPHARVASAPGPKGWAEEITAAVSSLTNRRPRAPRASAS